MVERDILSKVNYMATKFPVITLTGTRQCGKSSFLKNCFQDYQYISLEDPDIRQFAIDDPRGFLNNFGDHTIIDEAQYAPKLFSYIQTKVDSKNECGMFILSGSHNFLLMESITQSLAGRCAVMKMAPFSISELAKSKMLPDSLSKWLFTGGYPRIYDKQIPPADYFPSYIQTYIERDVRMMRNIGDLSTFIRFLKLCAGRIGQLLNIASLANECGISTETASAWLSILEASYVVYLLKPYYKNYNKRLVKSAKLYFYDTGLASALSGLTNAEQMSTHYMRGEMFENMVVAECLKSAYAKGIDPQMYYWRDSNQNEVDLLIENGQKLQAFEIKSSETMNSDFFKGLKTFRKISGLTADDTSVIYGGDLCLSTTDGKYISWRNIPNIII